MRLRTSRLGLARRAAFFAAAATLGVTHSADGITASWLIASNGNWTDPAQWSTNPNFPNNDTPAGTNYDAVIGATGASYTATLNSNITVDSLLLNSGTM